MRREEKREKVERKQKAENTVSLKELGSRSAIKRMFGYLLIGVIKMPIKMNIQMADQSTG